VTVYRDDPNEDDVKKVIYNYIRTDSTEREIAGGQENKKTTAYEWTDAQETRNGITKTVGYLSRTVTSNAEPDAVDITNLLPETVIYDTTIYTTSPAYFVYNDPDKVSIKDTVIDYRINDKGDYTVYTDYETKERSVTLGDGTQDVIVKDVVLKTEYHKGLKNGPLRSVTEYIDDSMYEEAVFEFKPMNARIIDKVTSYKLDRTTVDTVQSYVYKTTGTPAYDYNGDSTVDEDDYDADADDDTNVAVKLDAWAVLRTVPKSSTVA